MYLGFEALSGIAIYSFDFYDTDASKKINWKFIDKLIIENVLNLEVFLEPNSKNVYFLICSRNENKAMLLQIFNKNDSFEMSIIQSIENSFLVSTIFRFNNKYYLLNLDKEFTVWEFDEKHLLQNKYMVEIENKLLNDDNSNLSEINVRHPIIFLEEKKHFIVQLNSSIIVYEIDSKSTKELKLIFIKRVGSGIYLSILHENFFITKDKNYLIIVEEKKNDYSGLCVFDLNSYELVMEKKLFFENVISTKIKNIINLDNNLFVCTINQKRPENKKYNNRYSHKFLLLIQYYFNNENKKLELKLIQKIHSCNSINCKELINDHFLIVEKSIYKQVFKLIDDNKLIPLFNLFD